MIPGWYTDTVIRHRAAVRTGIRKDSNWGKTETAALANVRVQPLTSEESTEHEGSPVTHRLMAAVDVDLVKGDRLEFTDPVLGHQWLEVAADPIRYRGIFTAAAHSETVLRGINGR